MGILETVKKGLAPASTNSTPSGSAELSPSKSSSPGGGASALLQAHKDAIDGGRGTGQQGKKRGPYGGKTEYAKRSGGQNSPAPAGPPAVGLFNEENTGRLVALPFTLAAVGSNWDGWRLDTLEQKELAVTGSVALNEWVSVDPKWVALCLFSLSLVGVATNKAIVYQAELRARKMKEDADKSRAEKDRKIAGLPAPEVNHGHSQKPEGAGPRPGFIPDASPK